MVPKSERFELRLDEDQLNRIGEWAEKQDDRPSKAEAIRRLVEVGLSVGDSRYAHFTDGEKLLMFMMGDIYKALKIKDGEIDPGFITSAISGGHYWAPKWEMTGIYHNHVDDHRTLSHVVDVLDMWSFIESGYQRLSATDKDALAAQVGLRGKGVQFPGFDGNNEGEEMGIAGFMIHKMDRFNSFKGRNLNSHTRTYARYRRMVELFEPMREKLIGTELNLNQLATLLSV